MFKYELKKFVEENPRLVTMKESTSYPGLVVLKYSRRVFYDNLWTTELESFRGTIVDKDFNVISRPFQKIYNYGVEEKAPVLVGDTEVTAYRKVNGFMVAVTMHNGELLVSTTGSTDSPYVAMAKEMMITHQPMEAWEEAILSNDGWTFMFECVHPSDPHIVPEEAGMYFLGWRKNKWDSRVDGYGKEAIYWGAFASDKLNCFFPEANVCTVDELIAESKKVKHEGFVAYTADGQAFKIKSPYYLTSKWVARNPRTDKLMTPQFKEQIDEEYYPLVKAIQDNIEAYTALDEQARLAWVREFLER